MVYISFFLDHITTNLKINKLDLLSNNQIFEKPVIPDKLIL